MRPYFLQLNADDGCVAKPLPGVEKDVSGEEEDEWDEIEAAAAAAAAEEEEQELEDDDEERARAVLLLVAVAGEPEAAPRARAVGLLTALLPESSALLVLRCRRVGAPRALSREAADGEPG